MPSFILGIDAAWTAHRPSGVALLRATSNAKPRLLAVARSYEEFIHIRKFSSPDWQTRTTGTPPDVNEVLRACKRIAGAVPQVIALDIPLSNKSLTGRRVSDNAVTSAYVARGAGTHTPSEIRPGPISKALFRQLRRAGYQWLTGETSLLMNSKQNFFAETYPHPAIIELMRLPKRLAYKTSRLQKYWPEATAPDRWRYVCHNLDRLRQALAHEIAGVDRMLPTARQIFKLGKHVLLKNFEDALDAVVCAWIGVQILRRRAVAYGDRTGAIWVPKGD